MSAVEQAVLSQFARQHSVIITDGFGPCPVFARGDRRTVATHWLSRETVRRLKSDGLLTPAPQGLTLNPALREGLITR